MATDALIQRGGELLRAGEIASYRTPQDAVTAFVHLLSYGRNLDAMLETPAPVEVVLPESPGQIHDWFAEAVAADRPLLTEDVSKEIVGAYGIETARTLAANDIEEAVEAAHELGYPVALKVRSSRIMHKADAGGIALGLRDDEEMRDAAAAIRGAVADDAFEGFTVQPMVRREPATARDD